MANTQLSIFDIVNNEAFSDIKPHIVEKFLVFHQNNPHIYPLFKKYSAMVMNSGRKRYSIKTIIERIRWHVDVETKGEEFKINNNHSSCYVRLLIMDHPQYADFFKTRSTRH